FASDGGAAVDHAWYGAGRSYNRVVSAGRSISPKRRLVVAGLGTAMLALAGCSSTIPATPEEAVTSGPATAGGIDLAAAARLDEAIGRAMTQASIPGAIVGIWRPAGDYVRTFGVADKATHAPMQIDFYTRVGSVTETFTVTALLQLVDHGKLK